MSKLLKAAGPTSALPPQAISEDQYMRTNDKVMLERHPGAESGNETPDDEEIGREWHNDEDTLKSFAEHLHVVADGLLSGQELKKSFTDSRTQLKSSLNKLIKSL